MNVLAYILEDEPLYRKAIEVTFRDCRVNNYALFGDLNSLLESINDASLIFIIDHYLTPPDDGIDAVKKIKDRVPHALIIILSSQADLSVVKDYLNEGVWKYADKSDPNALIRVANWIRIAQKSIQKRLENKEKLSEIVKWIKSLNR